MEYPTQATIEMMSSWVQQSKCITFTGRTAHAGKLVKPFDLFSRCVQENPVWWFEFCRCVPKKDKLVGTRAPVWPHVRDNVLMQALSEVRTALGVSDEEVEEKKKNMVKKEKRVDGGCSQKALVGWEWTGHVPNRPSSGAADEQAVPEMMEELVSQTDAFDTSIERVPAARQQMGLVAIADSATKRCAAGVLRRRGCGSLPPIRDQQRGERTRLCGSLCR